MEQQDQNNTGIPPAPVADGSAPQVPDAPAADAPAPVADASTKPKKIKARLLVDSDLGSVNDIVELSATALKLAERQGWADSDETAVAYALSLQAEPAPTQDQ